MKLTFIPKVYIARADEDERSVLKSLSPLQDWDKCWCGAYADYQNSEGDFNCFGCCYGYNAYMQSAYGTCHICNSSLSKKFSCRDCEYEAWKANSGNSEDTQS
jgi:hypothetical protein